MPAPILVSAIWRPFLINRLTPLFLLWLAFGRADDSQWNPSIGGGDSDSHRCVSLMARIWMHLTANQDVRSAILDISNLTLGEWEVAIPSPLIFKAAIVATAPSEIVDVKGGLPSVALAKVRFSMRNNHQSVFIA